MRRLFSKEYIIEESQIVVGGNKFSCSFKESGRIIINSQYLKDFVGRKARVIVYVQRRLKK